MGEDEGIQNVVLVTGATRNVGAEVIRQLAGRDLYVRAAVTDFERARSMGWRGVEIVPFQYDDPATYPAVFTGVDRLVLVMPAGTSPAHADTIQQVVDVAVAAGVQHVVFISALGTEKLHLTAQWAVEQHLMQSAVAYTILRAGWFFQNLITQPQVREDIRQGVLRVPYGDAKLSGVDVRDVAAVAVVALAEQSHRNQIYTLGEHVMDMHEAAVTMTKVLGRPIRVEPITEHEAAQELRAAGMDRQVAKWWRIVYQLIRQGVYVAMIPDVSRVLGRPSIPFKQFVQDHRATWQ